MINKKQKHCEHSYANTLDSTYSHSVYHHRSISHKHQNNHYNYHHQKSSKYNNCHQQANICQYQYPQQSISYLSKNKKSFSLPKCKLNKKEDIIIYKHTENANSVATQKSNQHFPKCFNTKGYFHNIQPYSLQYLKQKHAVFQRVSKIRQKKQQQIKNSHSISLKQKRHKTIDADARLLHQKSLQRNINLMPFQYPNIGYYLMKGFHPKTEKDQQKSLIYTQYSTIDYASKAGFCLSKQKNFFFPLSNLNKNKIRKQKGKQNIHNLDTLSMITKILKKKKFKLKQNQEHGKKQLLSHSLNIQQEQQELMKNKKNSKDEKIQRKIQNNMNKIKIKKIFQNQLQQRSSFFQTQVLIENNKYCNSDKSYKNPLMSIRSLNEQDCNIIKTNQFNKSNSNLNNSKNLSSNLNKKIDKNNNDENIKLQKNKQQQKMIKNNPYLLNLRNLNRNKSQSITKFKINKKNDRKQNIKVHTLNH